MAELGRKVY